MTSIILMLACSLGLFIAVVLAVVGHIMLAISIYKDAQCLGIGCGALFLVLTILFGSIPAIIYLIVRSSYDAAENAHFTSSSRFAKTSIILSLIGVFLMLVLFLVFFNAMLASIPVLIAA